jgi:PAS domain S-box-containing protein
VVSRKSILEHLGISNELEPTKLPIDIEEPAEPATACPFATPTSHDISGLGSKEDATSETTVLMGSDNYRIAVSSIATAMLVVVAVLDVAGSAAVSRNRDRVFWLTGGAIVAGLGILAIARVSFLRVRITILSGVLVLIVALAVAFLDRLLDARRSMAETARDAEGNFRVLAEAIPHIAWTTRPDGAIDYCNKHLYEVMRLTEEQTLGREWREMIYPDDRAECIEHWQQALRSGDVFEMEYRLRDAEKGFRWYLGRAMPVRDAAGAVVKWFGIGTDIDDQKHNQQLLEQQIRERTVELGTANTKLQEEMRERDVARRELDQQNERMMHELTDRSKRATLLAKMGEHLQSCVS